MFRNTDLVDIVFALFIGAMAFVAVTVPIGVVYCGYPANKSDVNSFCYEQAFVVKDRCLRDTSDPACDLIQSQNLNVKVKQ